MLSGYNAMQNHKAKLNRKKWTNLAHTVGAKCPSCATDQIYLYQWGADFAKGKCRECEFTGDFEKFVYGV